MCTSVFELADLVIHYINTYVSAVAGSGFSRGDCQTCILVQKILSGKAFVENCIKMKEIGPPGRRG